MSVSSGHWLIIGKLGRIFLPGSWNFDLILDQSPSFFSLIFKPGYLKFNLVNFSYTGREKWSSQVYNCNERNWRKEARRNSIRIHSPQPWKRGIIIRLIFCNSFHSVSPAWIICLLVYHLQVRKWFISCHHDLRKDICGRWISSTILRNRTELREHAPMLYYWATETLWCAKSITKNIYHMRPAYY